MVTGAPVTMTREEFGLRWTPARHGGRLATHRALPTEL
jgi:hypothetical protein